MRWLDGITDSMDIGLGRWTGRPGVLQFMGSQKVRAEEYTSLNEKNTQSVQSLSHVQLFELQRVQPYELQHARLPCPSLTS